MSISSNLLPTSNLIDTTQLRNLSANSPEFKDYLIQIAENTNSMLVALNAKDAGIYDTGEAITGQEYFSTPTSNNSGRSVFRKVINFGTLKAAAGNTAIPHGLVPTEDYKFTRIYGVASDPANLVYLPLPYATATANDIIELYIDDTNVNITVGKDRSDFTNTFVVVEYLKY